MQKRRLNEEQGNDDVEYEHKKKKNKRTKEADDNNIEKKGAKGEMENEEARNKKEHKERKDKRSKEKHRKRRLDDASSEEDRSKEDLRCKRKEKKHDEEKTSDVPGNPDIGQWGAVSLGSTEQNNKFIRLLGGFKKKGNTVDEKKGFSGLKKFSTAAMSKTQEENLNKGLEMQYEHAFDTSRNKRGLGLGYEPAQDKTLKSFHIDKDAVSKSVKFD
eukprot:Seg2146.2 transcript_id=Seg2146.2/GoldUCD/mRNA.D3Y31 product="Lysine-rich nucleolar protein 1" protein_id=Seg2146.2/GoldUCD/D3Y31